jgi:hypothetical protein
MLCQISGEFRTPDGVLQGEAKVSFRRSAKVHGTILDAGTAVVVPDEVSLVTNSMGVGTIGLYPGRYQVSLTAKGGDTHKFMVFVPEEETLSFTQLLAQAPEVLPGDVQVDAMLGYANQAVAARVGAEAARDAAEDARDEAEVALDGVLAEASLVPRRRGPWAAATNYVFADLVQEGGSTYFCLVPHTSTVFLDDLGDVYWEVWASKGAAGAGAGDVEAANAGSEYTGVAAAFRANLGLVLGSDVQEFSQILEALAGLSPASDKAAYFTGAAAMALYTINGAGRHFLGGTTQTSFTAGTNARGQGQIAATDRLVFIQTADADPSGVTLPNTVSGENGRILTIHNRAFNPVWVYPQTGVIINLLAAGDPILLPRRSTARFEQRATTHWGATITPFEPGLPGYIQVVNEDGTGMDWVPRTGRILLADKTISNQSSVSFPEFDNSLYRYYEWELDNVKPVTDGVALAVRTSTDGGATYAAGASDYEYAVQGLSSGGLNPGTQDATASLIQLTNASVGSASTEDGVTGTLKMFSAGNGGAKTRIEFEGSFDNTSGNCNSIKSSGVRVLREDTTALRFIFSSGNAASGRIRMYGFQ